MPKKRNNIVYFPGSAKLRNHYSSIGKSLLNYEQKLGGYGHSAKLQESFQRGVVLVPVELLEAYHNDLLDIDCDDTTLSIARSLWKVPTIYLALLGLMGANITGLSMASYGTALPVALAVTLSLSLPFVFLWYVSHDRTTRRLRFAKIVGAEISRRRGGDHPADVATADSFNVKSLVGRRVSSTAGGPIKFPLIVH